MKIVATILVLLTVSNTAHAGLFQAIANYYNGRDHCQLKNYPGGVKDADVSQLPSYCGKGSYARQQRIERAIDSGNINLIGSYASGYPRTERLSKATVRKVGTGFLVSHPNGDLEYIHSQDIKD